MAAGAQAVYTDLKAPASLAAALVGVDTVITTATATQRGGGNTIPAVDLQGTLNLIEAAQAANVRHFIYTSAYGSAPNHPAPLYHIKGTCEAALEASGIAYTILRTSVFMEVWVGMTVGLPLMHQQPITLIGQGDHHHNFVSEADVAAFGLAVVDNPRAVNQRIDIGGPASYTWTQIAAAVGKALGAYLPSGSAVPLLPPAASDLINAHEIFETFIDMAETAPAYGVTLTTLDAYIRNTFMQ